VFIGASTLFQKILVTATGVYGTCGAEAIGSVGAALNALTKFLPPSWPSRHIPSAGFPRVTTRDGSPAGLSYVRRPAGFRRLSG